MSAHLRTRRAALGLTIGLALTLAACGGGGGSDDDAAPSGDDGATTTFADPGEITVPGFEDEPHEFAELDGGGKARFINVLAADGEGVDMDVYWGMDAETGKKAATVKYGEVSDWLPIEVDQEPFLTPADGGDEINVAFYPAGETDRDKQFMQDAENIDGDVRFTYAMGTSDSPGSGGIPASLGISYDHDAGEAPDGQAWVALSTIGVGGIPEGDFMVLSTAEGCDDLTVVELEGGSANAGQAFGIDPGEASFTASDANTECAERTDPIDLDLAAGDRYVIYAYGTSLDDRQLMAVPVGE